MTSTATSPTFKRCAGLVLQHFYEDQAITDPVNVYSHASDSSRLVLALSGK